MEKKGLPKEPALSRKARRNASVVVGGADGRVIEVAGPQSREAASHEDRRRLELGSDAGSFGA